jgi:ABC-type phosphate transport system ATPase subunit
LGVQRPLQRNGIGEMIMTHAIEQFARVADQTAICAMTLVAINGRRRIGIRS